MPTLSSFYGILIQMYWRDHPPPHFHARYAGYVAKFSIENFARLIGYLPPAQERLVSRWAREHQDELREAWKLCQIGNPPPRIAPLL